MGIRLDVIGTVASMNRGHEFPLSVINCTLLFAGLVCEFQGGSIIDRLCPRIEIGVHDVPPGYSAIFNNPEGLFVYYAPDCYLPGCGNRVPVTIAEWRCALPHIILVAGSEPHPVSGYVDPHKIAWCKLWLGERLRATPRADKGTEERASKVRDRFWDLLDRLRPDLPDLNDSSV